EQGIDAFELRAGPGTLAGCEAGQDHCADQVLAIGDPDALVIERGAAAATGGEQLVAQRVKNNAVDRVAVFDQCDRYAKMRNTTQIVAGAVQGVDNPGEAGASTLGLDQPTFLAKDCVIGGRATELLDDFLFGQLVDFAGEVHAVFLDHVQRVQLVHVAQQDVAGGAGGLDHEGDGGFLHGK